MAMHILDEPGLDGVALMKHDISSCADSFRVTTECDGVTTA